MLQSHIIDVDGAFVGAAVRLDTGYRFIATDMKLDDLDGSIWPMSNVWPTVSTAAAARR